MDRAIEVATRAELLRDLRADDTGEMLAYCARVLDALERRTLEAQHLRALPCVPSASSSEDRVSGEDRVSVSEAATRLGVRRTYIYRAIQLGLITAPGVSGLGVSWQEVQAWDAARARPRARSPAASQTSPSPAGYQPSPGSLAARFLEVLSNRNGAVSSVQAARDLAVMPEQLASLAQFLRSKGVLAPRQVNGFYELPKGAFDDANNDADDTNSSDAGHTGARADPV